MFRYLSELLRTLKSIDASLKAIASCVKENHGRAEHSAIRTTGGRL